MKKAGKIRGATRSLYPTRPPGPGCSSRCWYTVELVVTSIARLVLIAGALASCTANDDIHPPALAALTPDRAIPGSSVVASGNYFCGQPEADDPADVDPLACQNLGTVTFDGVPATVSQYSEVTIVVELPDLPPGPVTVRVSVAGRTSNGAPFTVE
jgi:hypothetical protein